MVSRGCRGRVVLNFRHSRWPRRHSVSCDTSVSYVVMTRPSPPPALAATTMASPLSLPHTAALHPPSLRRHHHLRRQRQREPRTSIPDNANTNRLHRLHRLHRRAVPFPFHPIGRPTELTQPLQSSLQLEIKLSDFVRLDPCFFKNPPFPSDQRAAGARAVYMWDQNQ